MSEPHIVVVGAGPVGAVAALACTRRGHRVTLLEAALAIDASPRASTTQPPTLEILAELGLIDEYIAQGLVARHFQFWDRPTKTLVAEFDFARLAGETPFPYVVQTEQHKLANMAIARLREMPDARVELGMRVTGVTQTADAVRVRATSLRLTEDPRRQSAQVGRLLHRLHVYGLVAKIPRSRRWRVTAFGHRVMSASVRLRHLHFPALYAEAA